MPFLGRMTSDRTRTVLLWIALSIQFLSALFFLGEMWTEVLGLRSFALPWQVQEFIQVFASVGLLLGVVVGVVALRRSQRRVEDLGRQMDVVSGRFQSQVRDLFAGWDLTPSEREVAIYAMKGFSNAEIGALRGTSASTVKSQLNAIYRKSGLDGRRQLISCLVDELIFGTDADEVCAAE